MATERAKARSVTEQFRAGPWLITSKKSHILQSEGPEREAFEASLRLPQAPEMIFADNVLRLQHDEGYGMEFNALDALKLVDADHDPLKVAVAEAWKEARADCEHINDVHKPFDWTYTTDYKGTLIQKVDKKLKVTQTTDRIDLEKLKQREKILFYDDIVLFEDELADNGASILTIKVRVMPSGFFLLLRQFMRVDNVLIRVNDTRIHHEANKDYLLREFTSRDDEVKNIKVKPHLFTDANEMANCLTVRKEIFEKLEFPESSREKETIS